jgi:hypothetical protein
MSKKDKKTKKGKKGAAASAASGICVAGHPRSAIVIRRAKGFGGLLGALLASVLAHGAHLPLLEAMLRGLAGGIVGYIAIWAVAVTVARQLVIAEVRKRHAEFIRETAIADALAAAAAAAAASDAVAV